MAKHPISRLPAFTIKRLDVHVYRAPIETPVENSFGVMQSRPAVLVRLEEAGGAVGWGEVWCNWPVFGAEHRARVVRDMLAAHVVGTAWDSPYEVFHHLALRTHVMAVQTGEPGPMAQAIAGIDMAVWDLVARMCEQPVWRLLHDLAADDKGAAAPADRPVTVPVYASGLNPNQAVTLAAAKRDEGYRAFKLKIGFGLDRDLGIIEELRATLGDDVRIMVDANQAWSLAAAIAAGERLAPFKLFWLEEPIPADSTDKDWQELAGACSIPLAGGENLASDGDFNRALRLGALEIIQPDMAKWGGFSGCMPLARRILGAGKRYCPHYLGGGVGLVASAHLLAAAGGNGMLEVDANDNPLRQGLAEPFPEIVDGRLRLTDAPGLGIAPGKAAERYRVVID